MFFLKKKNVYILTCTNGNVLFWQEKCNRRFEFRNKLPYYLQVTLLAIQKFKMQKINRNHEKSHILTHLLLWNIYNNASRNKEVKKCKKRRNKKHSNYLANGIMSHFYLFH